MVDRLAEDIAALQRRRDQLSARLQLKQARLRQRQTGQRRRDETRRKIVLGALLLREAQAGDMAAGRMLRRLVDLLEGRDAALFDGMSLPEPQRGIRRG